jgi:hypothetical protein
MEKEIKNKQLRFLRELQLVEYYCKKHFSKGFTGYSNDLPSLNFSGILIWFQKANKSSKEEIEKELKVLLNNLTTFHKSKEEKGGDTSTTQLSSTQKNLNRGEEINNEEIENPVAYFNICGERICILKEAIFKIIPESQLTIRLSGRWNEQVSKGDRDEEGNIYYIDHCKECFKAMIEFIRYEYHFGVDKKRPSLKVQKEKIEKMRGILDYFNIDSIIVEESK